MVLGLRKPLYILEGRTLKFSQLSAYARLYNLKDDRLKLDLYSRSSFSIFFYTVPH